MKLKINCYLCIVQSFVDIILPLPIEGLFTYAVPADLSDRVGVGRRALVPLGRSKTYTGLIVRVHNEEPSFETRKVIDVLDAVPIILPQQLKLWNWIADYYLSPIGDVMKAALPSGLKAEDGWKPKTELYVTLAEKFRSEQALHVALNLVSRSSAQQKVLMEYLSLSHWDTIRGTSTEEPTQEITREELMNAAHCRVQNVKSLEERGILATYYKEVGRLNTSGVPHPERIKQLSEPQQTAFDKINAMFSGENPQIKQHNIVLLHGVTSSGKTEIYIHLIQKAIEQHQQVLYLLPEIALTVQMTSRLKNIFGNRLGIYHSKYSDAERVEIWQKQLSNNPYDVILGARSAIFLPFQRLQLVIVDEEHETSFKQQEPAPRYHARSASIMLAQMYGAKTLLGSATPCMESWHNAQTGKYGYVLLTKRFADIALPEVRLVDVKDLRRRKIMKGPFSPTLLASIREALEDNKQVILFQNRRGFSPMIECKVCGWVPKCKNCDVSLTLHKNTNQLTCHYCGYTYQVPQKCPNCENTDLHSRGYGTEKIEDQIREIFPQASVARMDLDTTRTRNAYERIIDDFASGRTNVLIGTQMISKGLDFDRVSVVGILDADSMLCYPDFRSYEHAFMMMAQVSGRAGRKGKRGLVILQTKNPELPVIQQVKTNDYASFYAQLLEERRQFHYPPFTRLVYVYIKHRHESLVDSAAIMFASMLRQRLGDRVLGPSKPAVARVKTLHIRKIMLKLENGMPLAKVRQFLRDTQNAIIKDKRFASLQIYYDVDPS